MDTKLYIDNLAAGTTETEVREWFEVHGNVADVNVPCDRATGRPRGFAFVTMATPEGARSAIAALNGRKIGSSTVSVSRAWAHEQRPSVAHRE